jgi:copper chaperone CopZ
VAPGRSTRLLLVATLAAVGIALILGSCGGAGKKPRLATLTCDVKGMTCTGCEQSIVGSVRKIDGVAEARADFRQGKAVIRFDPLRAKPDVIRRAIEKAGYTVARTSVDD